MVTTGCVAAGCGAPSDDSEGMSGFAMPTASSTGASSGIDDGSGSTGVGGDTSTGMAEDDLDPPIGFDLGGLPDAGFQEASGCSGIDFLFVVDNSASMAEQQTQLLASFPGFIDAMETLVERTDSYHFGLVTSDSYGGNAAGCRALGDLVTKTSGPGASNKTCGPFASGQRYATDEDELSEVFPCMAKVGTGGSALEQPVSAAIAALDPKNAAPGSCNEGFLRDDAVLVVVLVTDDAPHVGDMDDAHHQTDTSGWMNAVLAAKGGDLDSVVVIGFVPTDPVGCTQGESPNLINFVEGFGEQGVLASVCLPDYGPVFASSIETIKTTCDNFTPQG